MKEMLWSFCLTFNINFKFFVNFVTLETFNKNQAEKSINFLKDYLFFQVS